MFAICWKDAQKMRNFYIDYPHENIDEYQHSYRCMDCKIIIISIFGRLENYDIN
jgi:hypothetical protein